MGEFIKKTQKKLAFITGALLRRPDSDFPGMSLKSYVISLAIH